jgi:hypothetical protein
MKSVIVLVDYCRPQAVGYERPLQSSQIRSSVSQVSLVLP